MCIFESDTDKRKLYLKILYRLLVYFTSLTISPGILKKKINKKIMKKSSSSSEFFFFFRPDPKSVKKSRKSTNKKTGLTVKQCTTHFQHDHLYHFNYSEEKKELFMLGDLNGSVL